MIEKLLESPDVKNAALAIVLGVQQGRNENDLFLQALEACRDRQSLSSAVDLTKIVKGEQSIEDCYNEIQEAFGEEICRNCESQLIGHSSNTWYYQCEGIFCGEEALESFF